MNLLTFGRPIVRLFYNCMNVRVIEFQSKDYAGGLYFSEAKYSWLLVLVRCLGAPRLRKYREPQKGKKTRRNESKNLTFEYWKTENQTSDLKTNTQYWTRMKLQTGS